LQIADLFLPPNELILETRGRLKSANDRYYTSRPPILSDMPMIVLIDRGSASASEIVAGILQDMDRAVILGSRSFGKGLVQTVYHIDDEASLKVTTAKYYLPSGRLIQKGVYGEDLVVQDSLEVDTLGFYTKNGRAMQGGGGITPDVDVAPLLADRYERQLWNKGLFFQFAVKYASQHPGLVLPFRAQDPDVEAFRTWLRAENYHYSTDFTKWLDQAITLVDTSVSISDSLLGMLNQARDLASVMESQAFDANYDRIRLGIEREVAAVVGGTTARFAAGIPEDLVLQQAVGLIERPEEMTSILDGTYHFKSVQAQ